MAGLLKKCQTQSHDWSAQKMPDTESRLVYSKNGRKSHGWSDKKNGRKKWQRHTDTQVSQLYISEIYEVWTVVLGLEAPYWLSYGQFGSGQNFGRYTQTDRFHNYILVRYGVQSIWNSKKSNLVSNLIWGAVLLYPTLRYDNDQIFG